MKLILWQAADQVSLAIYNICMSVCLSFSDKFSAIAATFYANENEICLKSFET